MTAPVPGTLITAHVPGAFAESGTASKAAVNRRGQETGGSDTILRTLSLLPDRTYAHMRELWVALPDVPIE